MLKQLWTLLFGCDNDFFKYNVREKMALIIIFVLAIMIIVTGKEFETVKYIVVGLLAFLKGNNNPQEVNDNIQQQIAKEKAESGLKRTIITEVKPNEVLPKPQTDTGE